MDIEAIKAWSEIFSNFASPLAVVVAAVIAVRGANKVAERIVAAKGAGVTVQAQAPTGTATATTTPQASAATVLNE